MLVNRSVTLAELAGLITRSCKSALLHTAMLAGELDVHDSIECCEYLSWFREAVFGLRSRFVATQRIVM